MPRTHAELSAATRNALLVEARRAFAEHGYAHAPIDALVQSVGMTKGALYHHFGSKQGLFIAVVEQLNREIQARIEQAELGPLDLDQFIRGCRVYLEASLEPDVRRVLLLDYPAVLGQRLGRELDLAAAVQPLQAWLSELIDHGAINHDDPEALAQLLAGALHEAALWIAEQPEPGTIERVLATLRRLLA